MCPASTRSNEPLGMRSIADGKWARRIERSASWSSQVGLCAARLPDRGRRATRARLAHRASGPRRPEASSGRALSARPSSRTGRASRRCRGCRGSRSNAAAARAARLSSGSPRGRETRSPVMHTRSGSRSRVHSTALRAAVPPRPGTPRWKSDRWAIRSPSSSGGQPRQLDVEDAETHPTRLVPRPRPWTGRGGHRQPDADPGGR